MFILLIKLLCLIHLSRLKLNTVHFGILFVSLNRIINCFIARNVYKNEEFFLPEFFYISLFHVYTEI